MRSVPQLIWRGGVLFFLGMGFTIFLSILQTLRSKPSDHIESFNHNVFCSRWWLPLVCGVGSAIIGLIYPCLEYKNSEQSMSQEWSHVLRCIAMYFGINEACTKVDFPSNLQLSFSLAVFSICLWWYFDRTTVGFSMGIIVAALALLVSQMLVYHRVCIYSESEFSYMRSWLPCVVFSGGITVGNIGKQLAVNDFLDGERKSHAE